MDNYEKSYKKQGTDLENELMLNISIGYQDPRLAKLLLKKATQRLTKQYIDREKTHQ